MHLLLLHWVVQIWLWSVIRNLVLGRTPWAIQTSWPLWTSTQRFKGTFGLHVPWIFWTNWGTVLQIWSHMTWDFGSLRDYVITLVNSWIRMTLLVLELLPRNVLYANNTISGSPQKKFSQICKFTQWQIIAQCYSWVLETQDHCNKYMRMYLLPDKNTGAWIGWFSVDIKFRLWGMVVNWYVDFKFSSFLSLDGSSTSDCFPQGICFRSQFR